MILSTKYVESKHKKEQYNTSKRTFFLLRRRSMSGTAHEEKCTGPCGCINIKYALTARYNSSWCTQGQIWNVSGHLHSLIFSKFGLSSMIKLFVTLETVVYRCSSWDPLNVTWYKLAGVFGVKIWNLTIFSQNPVKHSATSRTTGLILNLFLHVFI